MNFKILKMNDLHIPYQDDKAFNVALEFAKNFRPNILVLDEILDFYSISKFVKDPNRETTLNDEIVLARSYLAKIRKALPNTKIVMVESNHDVRLKKYLWSEAPKISNFSCLAIENLLCLEELKIEYLHQFVFRDIIFKHGEVVRPYSGVSARWEYIKEGMSGISGHTHRLAMIFHTNRSGVYFWMESGCLCTLNPEYMPGIANWQQGISGIEFSKGFRAIHPFLIPITNGELMWGGKIYGKG